MTPDANIGPDVATQHLLRVTETFESLLPGSRRPHRNGLRLARRHRRVRKAAHFHSVHRKSTTAAPARCPGPLRSTCPPMLPSRLHAKVAE